MSEFFRGALIIDLEENKGWEHEALPLHVPVIPQFTMLTENLPAASRKVSERLEDFESFVSLTALEPGDSTRIVRYLTSRTMMKLHLETLLAIREFTEPMDLTHIGDWYSPRITPRLQSQAHDNEVTVKSVTFALTPIIDGRLPNWEPKHAFNLKGLHE